MEFCASKIPEALGLNFNQIVDRSHRLGLHSADRQTFRLIIAKYLNYADKLAILQKYCQPRSLKILIFVDYQFDWKYPKKESLFNTSAQCSFNINLNSLWPTQQCSAFALRASNCSFFKIPLGLNPFFTQLTRRLTQISHQGHSPPHVF